MYWILRITILYIVIALSSILIYTCTHVIILHCQIKWKKRGPARRTVKCQLQALVTMYSTAHLYAYMYKLHTLNNEYQEIVQQVWSRPNLIDHLLQHAEPCSLMRFVSPAVWQQDSVDFCRAVIWPFGSFTQRHVYFI